MSFLAPLFLLGAAAIALPVLFHLVRRTTRERRQFSSLLFLRPTPPRLNRRSRLEHWLLLALRCLVLLLLAFGFARPFLKSQSTAASAPPRPGKIVVLVDASASMRRGDLWTEAQKQAEAAIKNSRPGDELALMAFGATPATLTSFDEWRSIPATERKGVAARKVAEMTPRWEAGRLAEAIIAAVDAISHDGGQTEAIGRVILISDLQDTSRVEPLQGFEWPKSVSLDLQPVKADTAGNASIQLIIEPPDPTETNRTLAVRVSNAADSTREDLQVGWSAPDGTLVSPPQRLYVPAGQSKLVRLPVPTTPADRILLQGDRFPFDNVAYVVRPEALQLSVTYIGSESALDARQPLYFLGRAFQQSRWQRVELGVVAPEAAADAPLSQLFFLAGSLPESARQKLRQEVLGGKTAVVQLRSASMAPTLAALLGKDSVSVEEVQPAQYAMLAKLDYGHPLFSPFSDPRYSDFTKIHFWRYRRIRGLDGGRDLATFDSGDPAIFEVPAGKGRFLVMCSGWNPADSQFALSTKFVPFLFGLLEQSAQGTFGPAHYRVGDPVPLQSSGSATASQASVQLPDGTKTTLAPDATSFAATRLPGKYSVAGLQPAAFAVNLDPAESASGRLVRDDFEKLGVPLWQGLSVSAGEARLKEHLANTELENRQKFWRWLIVAALGVLLVETWLGGRHPGVKVAEGEAA